MSLIKLFTLAILLLLLAGSIDGLDFVPCRSITLRGTITRHHVEPFRNCTFILGYFRVLNAKFVEFAINETTSSEETALFPNITEITDYVLVFQAHYISHLGQLLPRLAIVRGESLFRAKFSLVLFLSPSLTHVNLPRLVSIRRGHVLFSRLYHVCYVNTIDWSQIVHAKPSQSGDDNEIEPFIKTNLINRNCVGQVCLEEAKHCWTDRKPQIICDPKCLYGCNLDMPSQCCTNTNCFYCLNSNNNKTNCVSCSTSRDLNTGECISKCSVNQLLLDSHICISDTECRSRHYFVHSDAPVCSRTCPTSGYKTSPSTFTCERCPDGICKRNCSQLVAHLKGRDDLASVHNCVALKRLTIETSSLSSDAIKASLAYLEHIEDYLLVTRNRHIKSLNFLERLKSIGGKELFEKRYALFVHTNTMLRSLWDPKDKLEIYSGGVKFFENPKLCYQQAEKLVLSIMKYSQRNDFDIELSYNYNGYKRLSCSNRTLDIKTNPKKGDHIEVEWAVEVSDHRRLKGFHIAYAEITDQAHEEALFNDDDDDKSDGDDVWSYIYVPFSQESGTNRTLISSAQLKMTGSIDVLPFRWYAIFVKADLMVDASLLWTNRSSLFEYDKVISRVVRVLSLPAQPSRVESIEYEPISFDKVNLKWRAPIHANGILEFYFISYVRLRDMEKFEIPNGDNCQLDRYLMDSRENLRTTVTTTTEKMPIQNRTIEKSELCKATQKSLDVKNPLADAKIDDENNDLILVEDEIYNLAFRPAKTSRLMSTEKIILTTKMSPIGSNSSKFLTYSTLAISKNLTNLENLELDSFDALKLFNVTESLLRLVRQDLMAQNDEVFFYTTTSNKTSNLTIGNLTSFGRYIVSVIIIYISILKQLNENPKLFP